MSLRYPARKHARKQEILDRPRRGLPPALRFAGLLLLFFALEVAAHATLLRLPYYWDEAGYYIPAAYDFFRTGALIPYSTLTNAHPPGLSIFLAAAWSLFGFSPLTTRVIMCLAAACALVAVFRLTQDRLRSRGAAAAVVLLTAVYPVWFAQSTLAQADMLAATFTLWALVFALSPHPGRSTVWAASLCFTLAALTKEIAIGTPLALACFEALLLLRERKLSFREGWLRPLTLCLPALPLALWFAYHKWRTGFAFGNPQYLRYNATTTLQPERILLALAHRVFHLSAHLNLFVPVAIALGSLLLPPVPGRPRLGSALRARIWVILVVNAVLFSVLGGALLTRYLLPMYPLVLLLATAAVYDRFRQWLWYPALTVAAFLAALLLPAPYRIAPEDTLAYSHSIRLEQDAIQVVATRFPYGRVLSAWPVTDGLRKPELGYIRKPMAVAPIDNFSLAALEKFATEPADYSTAIVFSTKYDPPALAFGLGRWDQREEERFFGFHRDLQPATVAALLGGVVVWREQRGNQWAAVLRFAHPHLARLAAPLIIGRKPGSSNAACEETYPASSVC